jgi:hypothetical protein
MNKQIFNKCKTLAEYNKMSNPSRMIFYRKNKLIIDHEAMLYNEISTNRRELGENKKIHKIN